MTLGDTSGNPGRRGTAVRFAFALALLGSLLTAAAAAPAAAPPKGADGGAASDAGVAPGAGAPSDAGVAPGAGAPSDAGVTAASGPDPSSCAKCHGDLLGRAFTHSLLKNGTCLDCHLASDKLSACKGAPAGGGWKLAQPGAQLCAKCHDKTGDTPMHRIIEVRGCTACHDPHGAAVKKNLKAPAPVLCNGCHDVRRARPYVHRAVSAGMCTGCHDAHSGVEGPLLSETRAELCDSCHQAAKLSPAKHGAKAKGACLTCHDPHASELPNLLRPGKGGPVSKPVAATYDAAGCQQCHGGLTSRKFRHSVLKTGTCADCHLPSPAKGACKSPVSSGWVLMKPQPELCARCHDVTGDVPLHKIIGLRGCTACHDPHGSDEKKNLKAPAAQLCTSCHGKKDDAKVVHTAVKQGLCLGCHDPHSGVSAPQLKEERKDLCLGCHDLKKIAAEKNQHPPVVQGRCLECHAPHGSDFPQHLRATGKELCLRCHKAGDKDAAGQPSAARQFDFTKKVHNPVATGECTDCHEQKHSTALPKLLKTAQPDLCLRCHDAVKNKTPLHPVIEKKGCTACHDAHQSPNKKNLKVWPVDTLCYTCHERKDAKTGDVHPPVKNGQCLGCHEPHSGEDKPLLIDKKSELCWECHDKGELAGGPVVHTAFKEGLCTSCHEVHSSDGPKLLKAQGGKLCLDCHQAGPRGNPAVLGAARIDLTQLVVHKPVGQGDCQACHVQKHGAQAKFLLKAAPPKLCYGCHLQDEKTKALFTRPFLHSAVKVGDCTGCHSPHASPNPKLLLHTKDSEICFECHQDDLKGRAFVHKPAGEGKCLTCHDPHGSVTSFNLKAASTTELCFTCHPEKKAAVKVPHKALERYGCTACHDPHGTANASQLVKPVNALCQGCHPEKTDGTHATTFVRGGHKIAGPADPRRPGRTFSCASCHNPHGSDNPRLFYFGDSPMDMCAGCHGDKTGKYPGLTDVTRKPVSSMRTDGGVEPTSSAHTDGGTLGLAGAPSAPPPGSADAGAPSFTVRYP